MVGKKPAKARTTRVIGLAPDYSALVQTQAIPGRAPGHVLVRLIPMICVIPLVRRTRPISVPRKMTMKIRWSHLVHLPSVGLFPHVMIATRRPNLPWCADGHTISARKRTARTHNSSRSDHSDRARLGNRARMSTRVCVNVPVNRSTRATNLKIRPHALPAAQLTPKRRLKIRPYALRAAQLTQKSSQTFDPSGEQ